MNDAFFGLLLIVYIQTSACVFKERLINAHGSAEAAETHSTSP
jgi:hypothetical protein